MIGVFYLFKVELPIHPFLNVVREVFNPFVKRNFLKKNKNKSLKNHFKPSFSFQQLFSSLPCPLLPLPPPSPRFLLSFTN